MKGLIEKAEFLSFKGKEMFRRNVVEPAARFIRNEDGDVVQTVLIVALFAMIAVAFAAIIGNAVKGKATEASDIIMGAEWS